MLTALHALILRVLASNINVWWTVKEIREYISKNLSSEQLPTGGQIADALYFLFNAQQLISVYEHPAGHDPILYSLGYGRTPGPTVATTLTANTVATPSTGEPSVHQTPPQTPPQELKHARSTGAWCTMCDAEVGHVGMSKLHLHEAWKDHSKSEGHREKVQEAVAKVQDAKVQAAKTSPIESQIKAEAALRAAEELMKQVDEKLATVKAFDESELSELSELHSALEAFQNRIRDGVDGQLEKMELRILSNVDTRMSSFVVKHAERIKDDLHSIRAGIEKTASNIRTELRELKESAPAHLSLEPYVDPILLRITSEMLRHTPQHLTSDYDMHQLARSAKVLRDQLVEISRTGT